MTRRDPLALRDWIGVGLIAAFISVLGALLWKDIPQQNEQLIVYMLGQLSGFVATVVGYHYVTSVSDAKRTENTGAAFRAIEATAKATGNIVEPDVTLKPGETAQAEGERE